MRWIVASPVLRPVAALATGLHYRVRGDSMAPAYAPGDLLFAARSSLTGRLPSRGDVVVLLDPRDAGSTLLKRVVAVPCEEVGFVEGTLFVNGEPLGEPYLHGLPPTLGLGNDSWALENDEFFVLGDNRVRSTDSRDFGPVRANSIVGRVRFRYWPVRRS